MNKSLIEKKPPKTLFLFLTRIEITKVIFWEFNNLVTSNQRGQSRMTEKQKYIMLRAVSEIYLQSAQNNSNETYTFMCLGRAGHLGSAKTQGYKLEK